VNDNPANCMKDCTLAHYSSPRGQKTHRGHKMERLVHNRISWAPVPIYGRKTTEVVEEPCDED
jgi:hypothetical protein